MRIIFRTSEHKQNKNKKKINFSPISALKNLSKIFKDTEIYVVCDNVKENPRINMSKAIKTFNI